PLLLGVAPGVLVLAEVLLGQPVDLPVGALGRHLGAAADRDPLVGVLGVDDDQRDARILLEVTRLRASGRRVERDRAVVLHVDPDDGRVRRAVLAERRDDADVRVLQELLLLLVECCGCRHGSSSSLDTRFTVLARTKQRRYLGVRKVSGVRLTAARSPASGSGAIARSRAVGP